MRTDPNTEVRIRSENEAKTRDSQLIRSIVELYSGRAHDLCQGKASQRPEVERPATSDRRPSVGPAHLLRPKSWLSAPIVASHMGPAVRWRAL
jgi:hypothetical protein